MPTDITSSHWRRHLVIVDLLWRCHAHPQLPFPLLRLHLQGLHRIAQPVLSLLQLLEP
jgi:hypothetical protein